MLSVQRIVVFLFAVFSLCHCMLNVHKLIVRVPRENDIGLIFDLTVCNKPNDKKEMLNFLVRSDGLCTLNVTKETTLCGFSRIYGGDFGSIEAAKCETVSLIWPTVSLYNRVGFCPIMIVSSTANNEETLLKQLLYFDTRFETLDPDCHSLRKHKDYKDCNNWDKDYLHNCTPVNCEERYFGKRSFYNRRTEQCEPVPACVGPGIYYDIYANECVDRNHFITEEELEDIKQGKYDDNFLDLEPTTNHCDKTRCPATKAKQPKGDRKKTKVKKECASGGKRSMADFSCCLGNEPAAEEKREKKMTESHLIMQWLSPLKLASNWFNPLANEAAAGDGSGGGRGYNTTDAPTQQSGDEKTQPDKDKGNADRSDGKQIIPDAIPEKTSSHLLFDLFAGVVIVLITLGVYLVICLVIFLIVTWIVHSSTYQESRTSVTQTLTPRESDGLFSIMTKSSLLSQR